MHMNMQSIYHIMLRKFASGAHLTVQCIVLMCVYNREQTLFTQTRKLTRSNSHSLIRANQLSLDLPHGKFNEVSAYSNSKELAKCFRNYLSFAHEKLQHWLMYYDLTGSLKSKRASHHLASSPGPFFRGRRRKGLVHTVCACVIFPVNTGNS